MSFAARRRLNAVLTGVVWIAIGATISTLLAFAVQGELLRESAAQSHQHARSHVTGRLQVCAGQRAQCEGAHRT